MAKPKTKMATGTLAPKKGDVVRIKAVRDGYRRAGVAHSKAWATHAFDAFDADDLEALTADPNITIEIAADEKGEAAK